MILIDSSVLVAYRNSRDANHEKAKAMVERIAKGEWGEALLPEYVFLETVTVLAVRVDQATANETGEALLSAREFTFVPCSDVFLDAWRRFQRQPKSRFSFVDSALLALCARRGVDRIATFDADFKDQQDVAVEGA